MQHDPVDALGHGRLMHRRPSVAGAHQLLNIVVQRVRQHHFLIRLVGVALHACRDRVQFLPYLLRHAAPVHLLPHRLIALEQLGRVKR